MDNNYITSEAFEEIRKRNEAKIEELKTEYACEVNPSLLAVHKGGNPGEIEDIHGGIFGTIVHKLFELTVNRMRTGQPAAEQSRIPDEGDLRLAVDAGLKSNPLNKEQCRELKLEESVMNLGNSEQHERLLQHLNARFEEIYAQFLVSDLSKRILAAKNVYTELPFDMTIPSGEAEGLKDRLNLKKYVAGQALHVNGVIDLLLEFEEDSQSRFEIWDYKTNGKATEETVPDFYRRLNETYQYQLELYEVAVRRLLMENKSGKVEKQIYSLVREEGHYNERARSMIKFGFMDNPIIGGMKSDNGDERTSFPDNIRAKLETQYGKNGFIACCFNTETGYPNTAILRDNLNIKKPVILAIVDEKGNWETHELDVCKILSISSNGAGRVNINRDNWEKLKKGTK